MRIDESNENFGTVLTCAVRYACGRCTYIPSIVISFIRPLVSRLSTLTLINMKRDIKSVYDNKRNINKMDFDKNDWMDLLHSIQTALDSREKDGVDSNDKRNR